MLNEKQKLDLLKTVPGSRRTATGVLIEGEGHTLHITGMGQKNPQLNHSENFFTNFCSIKEIIRLREIKSSNDYLLRVRAEAIVDNPRLVRVFEKRRSEFSGVWSLSYYYNSLNEDPKRYIGRLPKKLRRKVKSHPFGFVPLIEANASCYKSLVGQFVTVSESLRHFYYYLSIFIYGGNYSISDEDRNAAAHIAVRLMTGEETLDFDIDSRGVLPSIVEAKIQSHVGKMIEFTFGHEFAHLLLGHTEDQNILNNINSGKQLKTYNYENEYEADFYAVDVVQDKKARFYIYAAGCDVFLYLHFLGLLAHNHTEIPDFSVSRTHPSPLERLNKLRGSFKYKKMNFERSIDDISKLAENFSNNVRQNPNQEILSFYGSIYMPGLGGKLRRDRIDF